MLKLDVCLPFQTAATDDSPFSKDETGTDNKDKVGWLWLTLAREANQVQVVLVARGGHKI